MHHGSPMPCLDLGYWGSLGSYVCANIGPLFFFCLFTRLRATFLGICRALSIAESSKIFGYPLSMSCFLISKSLWSLFSGSLQILIILMLNPEGMAFLVWARWHELVCVQRLEEGNRINTSLSSREFPSSTHDIHPKNQRQVFYCIPSTQVIVQPYFIYK